MAHDAVHTFDKLQAVLRRLHGDTTAMQEPVDLGAPYLWTTMYGFADGC